ncbi:SMI1/KNR4 family protein [Streptomyces sp. HUAS ZL42]|uniref:SMI1/KNR4 family protein n=1 Tax=Streptomyces sp. HUAS ZL42 TaxID=3231715 RepID=UPI00345E9C32
MSHPAIARLRQLLPPPLSGGDALDWDALSDAASLRLPADYREFVEIYGGGELDEYLSVSTPPVPGSPYGDLLDGTDPALPPETRAELAAWFPDDMSPRLLPFGSTASSDVVFWMCVGSPDDWKVAVFRRQSFHGTSRWIVFDGGMAEFLTAVLAGSIDPFSSSLEAGKHHYLNWRDE